MTNNALAKDWELAEKDKQRNKDDNKQQRNFLSPLLLKERK